MLPATAAGQAAAPLPSPLGLADVVRIAGERRDEIQAARAHDRVRHQLADFLDRYIQALDETAPM